MAVREGALLKTCPLEPPGRLRYHRFDGFRGGLRGLLAAFNSGRWRRFGNSMHEFSLIRSLLDVAFRVAQENGGLPIERVVLEIGALQQVAPEALEMAFDAAVQDTPAEGAVLEWEEVPVSIQCYACQGEYAPADEVFWTCPYCGASGGRPVQGDELVLRSVVLRDTEEDG